MLRRGITVTKVVVLFVATTLLVVAWSADSLAPESRGSVHQGRNDGDAPLVIYLSTLFPADAPRAIVVDSSPTP